MQKHNQSPEDSDEELKEKFFLTDEEYEGAQEKALGILKQAAQDPEESMPVG